MHSTTGRVILRTSSTLPRTEVLPSTSCMFLRALQHNSLYHLLLGAPGSRDVWSNTIYSPDNIGRDVGQKGTIWPNTQFWKNDASTRARTCACPGSIVCPEGAPKVYRQRLHVKLSVKYLIFNLATPEKYVNVSIFFRPVTSHRYIMILA